jgi:hypothetical protein
MIRTSPRYQRSTSNAISKTLERKQLLKMGPYQQQQQQQQQQQIQVPKMPQRSSSLASQLIPEEF